jgi:hypothetical protein
MRQIEPSTGLYLFLCRAPGRRADAIMQDVARNAGPTQHFPRHVAISFSLFIAGP